jgi:hypothetical protein
MNTTTWLQLARDAFPDLGEKSVFGGVFTTPSEFCEEMAWAVNAAHGRSGDNAFLDRGYQFIRWSIQQTLAEEVTGAIAHGFLDAILDGSHSKVACVDYLDWGDVKLISDGYSTEPDVRDAENFERLCKEWQKRWSRNQKLPSPNTPSRCSLPD